MRRFNGRDHTNKAERLIQWRAQLMNLIWLDKHGITHADIVPHAVKQHLTTALHDNDAMRVRVALMCRMASRRDREIADDEIACAFIAAD